MNGRKLKFVHKGKLQQHSKVFFSILQLSNLDKDYINIFPKSVMRLIIRIGSVHSEMEIELRGLNK